MATATCLICRREQLLGVLALAAQTRAPSHLFIPNASTQGPPTSSAVQVNQAEISARAFSSENPPPTELEARLLPAILAFLTVRYHAFPHRVGADFHRSDPAASQAH